MVVDYGEGTELEDGRIITGVITVTMSEARNIDGAVHSVVYDAVKIDDVSLSGSMTKTFAQSGAQSTIEKEYIHTFDDGTTIESRTLTPMIKTHTAGMDTPQDHKDDVTETIGSTQSVDKEGNIYTKNIVEALVKNGDYKHIIKGVVSMLNNGAEFATVDYGDGTYDNLMSVTTAEGTSEMKVRPIMRVMKNQQ